MKTLKEFVYNILDSDNTDKWNIIHSSEALFGLFDGNVPAVYEEMFIYNERQVSDIIHEHLKNINSKYLLKDIDEYFSYCKNVHIDNDELIKFECNKNISKDTDFLQLLNIYQYTIKTNYKSPFSNKWIIHIEKNFPKNVTNQISSNNKDRVIFHLTDRHNADKILKVGFRPGFHFRHPELINKQIWKEYKTKHDKNDFNKTYFFYITDYSNNKLDVVKKKAKEIQQKLNIANPVLLSIVCNNGTEFYKDNTMNINNCCFTYNKIPHEWIKEIQF